MSDMIHLEITKTEVLPNHKDLVKGAVKTYAYRFNVYESNKLVLQDRAFIGVTIELLSEWKRRLRLKQVKQTIKDKVESYLLPYVKTHLEDLKNPNFKRSTLIKSKNI